MEFKGKTSSITIDPITKRGFITFEVENISNALSEYEDIKDKALRITAKIFRKKRSLNANDYFWVLAGQVAKMLHTSSTEIHDRYVFNYCMPYLLDDGQPDTCYKPTGQDPNDHQTDPAKRYYYILVGKALVSTSYDDSLEVGCWMRIKGTSDMDTQEMAMILDDLIQEAKALGIQTDTPEEVARWQNSYGAS